MYKILVVDDEELICHGIKSMIERIGNPSVGEIFTAYDAFEAEAFVALHSPHIVITDIRMPNKTGIQFIKDIKPRYPELKFVVLSGYDEFQYAKEVFKLGVVDYLLKPASMQELKKVLSKIVHSLDDALNKKEQEDSDTFNHIWTSLQSLFYKLISMNRDSVMHTEEILSQLKRYFSLPFYTAAIMGLQVTNPSVVYDADTLDLLMRVSRNYTIEKGIKVYAFLKGNNDIIILMNHNQENGRSLIDEYCRHIMDVIGIYKGTDLTIGISQTIQDMNRIVDIYLQAEEALSYRLIMDQYGVISYDDLQNKVKSADGLIEDLKEVKEACARYDFEHYSNAIDALFNKEKLADLSTVAIEGLFQRLISMIRSTVDEYDEAIEKKLGCKISTFLTLKDLRIHLKDLGYKAFQQRFELQQKDSIGEIAKRYVMENYRMDIDMAVVANGVGMSYSYFSKLFKDETGINFSEYVMEVRMKEAARILIHTAVKVQDAAAEVGYDNPKHFTRAFRNYFGMSPMEFRKKNTM